MRLLRFIPIKLTLILVLGIVLGKYLDFGLTIPAIASLSLFLLLGILYFKNNRTPLLGYCVVLLTMSIGVLAVSSTRPENISNHYSNQTFSENQVWHLKIREVLKPTQFSNRYIGMVQSVEEKGRSGKILVSTPRDSIQNSYKVDDELIFYGASNKIQSPLNPHQFDYSEYMQNLGVVRQVQVESNKVFVKQNPSRTLYGFASQAREHIITKLRQANFGEEELSIIQALLLGQRSDISEATYDNYKNAGAVHILAVSGLHIGILLIMLQFVLKPLERLPKGKTIKLITVVLLLWGFALLAGFSASIVRAVTMFSFVAYALYLNRPSNTFNILALSMFFILLIIDPNLLFQVGFQMSYAAVLAIVWVYPLLQRLWYPKNKIIRYFWQLLSVSIAAQLGVLPISLFYFHQFPGLFFISNLLVIPGLGFVLGTGILVIILAVLNRLPDFFVSFYDTIIGWLNDLIGWVAQQEAFIFKNISFDGVQLLLSYVIIIGFIVFLTKPNFRKLGLVGLGIISFQLWMIFSEYETSQKETLLLAHQTKNSILIHQEGSTLKIISNDSTRLNRIVTEYRVAERVDSLNHIPLQNSYKWIDKDLFLIDSMAVYPREQKKIDYLILTQSPKINLNRLIDSVQPNIIIADGSNYRSYVNRWRKTCTQRKLPFHYTGEKGAYYFE
ncbi:ComEC/Rec2 family competence protein [Pseudozobellia sp. WGM2]|uniref:ComEC/Rec2 family competence protein n=1 Tax=Pseudozobellia sp. WGM2 TaxID=2787625 RepID=UPI001ADF4EC3|nr:ComEC/Rec2 family competence protein [Pseudozobellia sp. WGM2]